MIFKFFLPIKTISDCLVLQSNLDVFVQWCTINKMQLNPEKCQVLSFFRNQRIHYNYTIGDVILDSVETKRDLGVIFDRQFTFKPHIDYVIDSANKSLGYLLRLGRNIQSIKVLRFIFFSIVRSRLEDACVIWAPDKKKLINALERVQKRFAKYLEFRLTGSYPIRGIENEYLYSKFNLQSLSNRRKVQRVLYFLKIVRGTVDSSFLRDEIKISIPRINFRNHLPFEYPRCTNSIMYKLIDQTNKFYLANNDSVNLFVDSISTLCNRLYNYYSDHS